MYARQARTNRIRLIVADKKARFFHASVATVQYIGLSIRNKNLTDNIIGAGAGGCVKIDYIGYFHPL